LANALASAPDGYIVKPYNEHSLRTTIEVAFSRHAAERIARLAYERERAQLEQKYSDMTSLARRLRRESTLDPLTGLCNRRRLEDIARREISFGQRDRHAVGLVLLDLDHFKQMNDSFGHAAGDAALCGVADLVKSRVRSYDVACRYGGEEIIIVVPGEAAAGATALAEYLRTGIEGLELTFADLRLPRLTASFGVSSFPEHGWEFDGVLAAADKALYRAKRGGRNRVVTATLEDVRQSESTTTGRCALIRDIEAGDDRGDG